MTRRQGKLHAPVSWPQEPQRRRMSRETYGVACLLLHHTPPCPCNLRAGGGFSRPQCASIVRSSKLKSARLLSGTDILTRDTCAPPRLTASRLSVACRTELSCEPSVSAVGPKLSCSGLMRSR